MNADRWGVVGTVSMGLGMAALAVAAAWHWGGGPEALAATGGVFLLGAAMAGVTSSFKHDQEAQRKKERGN